MTVAQICVSAYLIVGLLAAALLWVTLVVSKRRDDKEQNTSYNHIDYSPFRERKTKPSSFHS